MSRNKSLPRAAGWVLVGALAAASGAVRDVEASPVRVAAASVKEVEKETAEVVYRWRKTVEMDGRVREELLVDTVMKELDRREILLDTERMIDSLGRAYEMSADAHQDTEDSPVVYQIELRRVAREHMTEAEREEAFLAAKPGATDADLAAFRALRAAEPEPEAAIEVKDDVREWLSSAREGAELEVIVQLQRTESALRLPKVGGGLLRADPAVALSRMKERLVAMEERKNELGRIQAPLIRDMEAAGGRLVKRYWLINAVRAKVTPGALRTLMRDGRVRRIERFTESVADTNNMDDMRAAAQVVQLHDAGADGESPSGKSAASDIFVAIIDDNIDADHPAWRDTSVTTSSRLTDIWRESGAVWSSVSTSAVATPSHGTKVTGIVVADLMQGQDPAITSTADRDDRTGFAPEASFTFIESSAGIVDATEKAVDLDVDIINYSRSTDYSCLLSSTANDAVDAAMLADVFFVKSSGSNASSNTPCNVGTPGAASGAFTVTALERDAVPLNTGTITSGASLGPDANGRAVVAIAAYSGPEGETDTEVGDTYGLFGATSAAAPVVAGTAASLKDHLLDVFSSTIVNEVGYLYAIMLLMGDGQMDGGVALAQDEIDGKWGVGRLRTRMFDAAGMDAPWRARLFSRTIEDGEHVSDVLLNPNDLGVNQDLSSDVDRIRATVFWHEPNIEASVGNWATISSALCNDDGFCYGSGNSLDPRQRHRIGSASGNKKWWMELNGVNVPPSLDTDYHHNLEERKVYIAVYWEDGDRDDADGPSSSIQ